MTRRRDATERDATRRDAGPIEERQTAGNFFERVARERSTRDGTDGRTRRRRRRRDDFRTDSETRRRRSSERIAIGSPIVVDRDVVAADATGEGDKDRDER